MERASVTCLNGGKKREGKDGDQEIKIDGSKDYPSTYVYRHNVTQMKELLDRIY